MWWWIACSSPPPLAMTPKVADPPADVRITVEKDGFVVESRGAPARLRRALALERKDGDTWAPLANVGPIWIREGCEPKDQVMYWADGGRECVEVGRLVSPPWNGMIGDAQCMCEQCAAAPPGEYRLVAEGCDDGRRWEGAPFRH